MDKRSHDRLWCALELAAREAWALTRRVTIPAILLLQGVVWMATYVAPRLTASARTTLVREQEALGLLVVTTLPAVAWLMARRREHGPIVGRLSSSNLAWASDVTGLLATSAVAAALWSMCSLHRITLSAGLIGAASTLASIAGIVLLAPGLARLPIGSVPLVILVALLAASTLGFFGPTSPLRADTVFAAGDAAARWPADALASLGCISISWGITRWRRPDPSCG